MEPDTNTNAEGFSLTGLKRPDVITSLTRQRAIFVRDASNSMSENNKARDASRATQNFLAELAKPENKDGFYVAVIDYSDDATIVAPFAKATELEGTLEDIETRINTNITAGLKKARKLLEDTPDPIDSKERFLKPVVILFSDGCHNEGPKPHTAAKDLKDIADLITVAFGSDADENLLREIATTPEHCYRCQDGKDLRAFMAAVGDTLTTTMLRGEDATQPLGEIGH